MSRTWKALALAVLVVPCFALSARAQDAERFSLAIAGGLTQTNTTTAPFFTANVRFRLGEGQGDAQRGISGFVAPEVGYWNNDDAGVKSSDLMVGVNVGGAVRMEAVEYYIGAGIGAHFVDTKISSAGISSSTSDTRLGVDALFGVDIAVSDSVSVFGVGRFDLVDKADKQAQGKAYVGLRFHF